MALRGLKLAVRHLQADYWSRRGVHVGGFKPTAARVAASRGRAHGIQADLLQLGMERASVRQGVGLVGRTGSW
jgi:hypothetical protein